MTTLTRENWNRPFRHLQNVSAACCLILLAACSQDNLPELTAVSGKITYKGEPLTNGAITFVPVGSEGNSSASLIDTDGHYELRYSRSLTGVAPGEYRVRLESQKVNDAKQETGSAIPRKFESLETSGLTATVKKARQQIIDFDLTE